ncbi:MAG: hypothetical protein M1831_003956 [Alyxoria varia]|nr:MAG: hypothetical protein M1831_003956 [Alyxoria varia]
MLHLRGSSKGVRRNLHISTVWLTRCTRHSSRVAPVAEPIKEGERVLLQSINTEYKHLTHPLKRESKTQWRQAVVQDNDIIGLRPLDKIHSQDGTPMRVQRPTLGEYITETRRLVTPVYPSDASTIVSLLDIHVTGHESNSESPPEKTEILEIGTGHGSLTLHLARAIHAANAHLLPPSDPKMPPEEQELQHPQDVLKDPRRFILHTLDSSAKHLAHAQKIIHGFRGGLYTPNISFHSGALPNLLHSQYTSRNINPKDSQPFLSYVIIDIPGAHDHLAQVAPAMHRNATLAVYCPNVTQLVRCEKVIKKMELPFWMEKAVELGTGISGGREWLLRHPRRPGEKWKSSVEQDGKNAAVSSSVKQGVGSSADGADAGLLARAQGALAQLFVSGGGKNPQGEEKRRSATASAEKPNPPLTEEEDDYRIVCRPKAGYTVPVSGFLGIWRRMPW